MSKEKLNTVQKALQINLDAKKYGTFAEIGAGQEVARWFFADPLTDFLVHDGVWLLADLVADTDPALVERIMAKNDVASLVEDLLADPQIRLRVTRQAIERAVAAGRAAFEGDWNTLPDTAMAFR